MNKPSTCKCPICSGTGQVKAMHMRNDCEDRRLEAIAMLARLSLTDNSKKKNIYIVSKKLNITSRQIYRYISWYKNPKM